MKKVSVLVQMELHPQHVNAAKPVLKEFQENTLREKGLDYFYLVQDDEDPSKVYIIERWDSQTDFENHIAGSHFREFGQKGKNLIQTHSITKLVPFFN